MLENTVQGDMIAHLDYSDCDTCTSSHVTRPACTVGGVPTNVFPTVTYEAGSSTETDPIYELADDAGGRFAIEANTNRLVTGLTSLDHELVNGPSGFVTGVGSWACSTGTPADLYCFGASGINNQVPSNGGTSESAAASFFSLLPGETQIVLCLCSDSFDSPFFFLLSSLFSLLSFFLFSRSLVLFNFQAHGMQRPRSGPSTSTSQMSLVASKPKEIGKNLDRFLLQSELKM